MESKLYRELLVLDKTTWAPELMAFYAQHVIQSPGRSWRPPNGLRLGQWIYNDLHDIRPDLANKITMFEVDLNLISGVDPFHNDNALPKFFTFLADNWEDS